MCLVKTPKIKAPTPTQGKDKPLPILTNPILDGIDPLTNSLRVGRSSLRIDRGAPLVPKARATATGASLRIATPATGKVKPNRYNDSDYSLRKIGFG